MPRTIAKQQQQWPVGTKVRKYFDSVDDWFEGHVTAVDPTTGFYSIEYEDGDAEEFDPEEMKQHAILDGVKDVKEKQKQKQKQKQETPVKKTSNKRSSSTTTKSSPAPTAASTDTEETEASTPATAATAATTATATPTMTTTRRGRKRAVVNYAELDDVSLDSEDEEEEEEPPQKSSSRKAAPQSKRSKRSTSRTPAARPQYKEDDDDDDDDAFSEDDDDEEDEDLMDVDDEEDEDDDFDEDIENKPKNRRRKQQQSSKNSKKIPQQKKKKAATAQPKKADDSSKKSMAEGFQPINRPLYWTKPLETIQEEHEYLDPCGMEATDDIIDHLVGEQVLKIGTLLQRALQSNNKNILGTKQNPLKLGTVCSGTDAPALALTMVSEQMERFGVPAKLHVEHKFSCEKEPFKQSYLARNFDSTLYPDVVKLTESDAPHDVYGRPTPIPSINVLIAGTSCKNFSMLHSTKRLDIEDKGCSGETFLATIELVLEQQPDWFILENVTGAPWKKMEEYIHGRVPLATVNDEKNAIQKTSAKDAKIKELKFELQKNQNTGDKGDDDLIVAVEVPMHVGVRCGAVVKGFLKGGTKTVIPAKWPNKKQKTCTLNDLLGACNGKVDRKQDTLMFDMPVTYCTWVANGAVDTKNYGLPQTRERTYMYVWQPAEDPENYDDDLGVYWQAIIKFLESPVKHSLEAFILDEDHDNIRVFREALHGPPGRHTKRSVFQEPDFFTSGNANVKHNTIAREKLGIEMYARPNVGGGARGKKQVPPHYWLEYLDTMQQREIDMLDILHISAARDAETHDSNFSSFFWNISQNVSKEKHRMATPGIAGCISPGGELFCSNLGRTLLGCEKLLLQGIPYFRLALGSESEVELGDMAGNAMSLTVVCAAQLAAIIAPQLREECPGASQKEILKYLESSCGLPREKTIVTPSKAPKFQSLTDAGSVFGVLAKLAPEAVASSVWCTCETSGRNTSTDTFMECPNCRISCCSSCLGSHNGYQMSSHAVQEKRMSIEEHHMGHFQSKLRNVAPSSLVLDKEGIQFLADLNDDVHRVADLWKFVFNLQDIKRQRRKWVIHYNARDNDGVGEVVAEFRITVGELWRQNRGEENSPELGMTGELISYFPAKMPPLVRGKLECCAVVTVHADSPDQCQWLARDMMAPIQLEIVGSDPSPSVRVELGLTDLAANDLRDSRYGPQKKWFNIAEERGEVERWVYPENWKEWPDTLSIHSDKLEEINGEYKRASCRQTANQSAIWIRHGDKKRPPLYVIIKPNVGRTGPDTPVISKSISHDDFAAIMVTLSSKWQPCHALDESHHSQDAEQNVWSDAPLVRCSVPKSSVSVVTENSLPSFLTVKGLSSAQVNMLYPFETSNEDICLNVHHGTEAQKITRAFNYLCAPPIMRHAARDTKLSVELSPDAKWNTLTRKAGKPMYGLCDQITPRRPVETWYFDEERTVWARRSNPEESRKYYINLQNAQKAFEFHLKRSTGMLSIKCFPEVAAHHAARYLVEGRGDKEMAAETVVSYRLSDTSLQSDPEYSPFKVYPCTKEEETNVALKSPYVLYERQQKVVTKMSMIESGNVDFEELEMSEHEMPGSNGFSLMAKASRNRKISGGVIADAIGAGKTVISIAMMLQGLKAARASRSFPRQSGATAVVVPSALVGQWESEIKKFSSEMKSLCIHDCKSLEKTTLRQIIEADVVIFPVDIIEGKGYTENLVAKSGLRKSGTDIPPLPKSMGHAEKPGAKGVWIPATSRDPYGIGSANEMKNQKLRDISAYFTHSYLDAIKQLRGKTFKETDKGVPLEYFEWERIIVDEIHECLCTEKDNLQLDWFKEKNRRASRELLGITQKDLSQRPLVYRKSIFGLTGTPLLDNSNRVIELANLIGSTYVIGLASHWRKLERESRRDIFLQHYLEPKQSREIRKAIYSKCQSYLEIACCRNTTEKELEGIEMEEKRVVVRMNPEETKAYIASQHGIDRDKKGLGVRPENFDPSAGHDISKFLQQNADSVSRGKALVDTCQEILSKDPTTKIIVFTDGRIAAGHSARRYLEDSGLGCTWLAVDDPVEVQNRKIAFYQRPDSTEEDRKRPRVLVLHFDHAAGLNLQKECYNLILYSPLYVGDGGITGDPVSDASTEQQAIGRVFRPGQLRPTVFVYRIELQGPKGEECLDGYLIRRNTDEQTLAATTNAA